MTPIIYFILGLVVGILITRQTADSKNQTHKQHPDKLEYVGVSSKATGLIEKQSTEKAKHKEAIMNFLEKQNQIDNNQVQELLGVSDATATRYLEELEKEGFIKQVGSTGRSVYYQKNVGFKRLNALSCSGFLFSHSRL